MKTVRELSHSESRPRENGKGSECKTAETRLEEFAVVKNCVGGIPCHGVLIQTEGVLERHSCENEERYNLKGEACQHGVDSGLLRGVCVCSSSYPTTCSLKNKGEKIAAAEYEGVCARTEARDGFAEYNDNPSEAKIDSCRQESGSDRQADNVDDEVVASRVERIFIEEDSCSVANNLSCESQEHSYHVPPGLMSDA